MEKGEEILFNGEKHPLDEPMLLMHLLKAHQITMASKGVAVSLNETVIPRSKWDEQVVHSGDSVDIIKAVERN